MTDTDVRQAYYRADDGLELFYRDYASQADTDADPVLCLPGLTRNSDDFEALAVRLCRRRRVITPDLRGRGRSAHDPDLANYRPARYVDDVFALLAQLGMQRVAIVGTSLGGWLAMLMADRRPAVVTAVVMNDIGPDIEPAGLARVLASAGRVPPAADWDEAIARLREHYGIVYPDWSRREWLRFARGTYRESNDGRLEIMLDRNVGEASRRGLSGLDDDPWRLFEALSRIPLLVVRGAESDILSAAIVERMRHAKPDLESVVVPRRGHAPYLDEPDAVEAVEKFLDAH